PDVAERREMLQKLVGIEDHVWMQVDEFEKIRPIADQDLERDTEDKTSAVHFLQFDLPPEQIDALKNGASLAAGIDHAAYQVEVRPVPDNVRTSLLKDLDWRPRHRAIKLAATSEETAAGARPAGDIRFDSR